MDIIKHNSIAWDKVSGTRLEEWSKPVSAEIIEKAKNSISEVLLTSAKHILSNIATKAVKIL